MKKLLSFCVVFGLLAGGAQAASIPISLFNTGVDNSGVSLANGAIDHHWLLNPTGANTETPANTQPTVATSAHGFPIGPWLGDSTTSAWITPNAALTGPNDNSGAAGFIYSEAFTTTSDASEVTISGGAGADNNVVGVALDGGAPIVFSNPSGFGALDPYTISGLLIGTSHVIQFYVANGKGEGGGDGYTGFREEFTSAAFTPVPEPGSLAGLLGFGGMSIIGLGWRRRRNALTAYIPPKTCDRATLPIIHSHLCMKVGVNAMKKLLSFCVVFGLLAGSAQAALLPISLSNTGQGLSDGSTDPNYTITTNPDGTGLGAIVEDSSSFPIVSGPWVADTTSARWIGPRFNTSPSAGGTYEYTITFTLPTDARLSSAAISGSWAFDDGGGTGGIFLNGNSEAGANPGFSSLTSFNITSGFVIGLNTLQFEGTNQGTGYTGLLVSGISGSFLETPEPASVVALVGLGGMGLIGMALRRRRRA